MNNGPGRFGQRHLKQVSIPACDYASIRGFVPKKKARPVWGLGTLFSRASQRHQRSNCFGETPLPLAGSKAD